MSGKALVALLMTAIVTASLGVAASGDETPITDDIFGSLKNPPQFTVVKSWEESNFRSTPFSTSPFDSRNSESIRKTLATGFKTVLGVCSSAQQIGCLKTVEYSLDSGATWKAAILQRSPGQRGVAFGAIKGDGTWDLAYTTTYAADTAKGLFAATEPNYWQLPGAKSSTGDSYFINATVQSHVENGVSKLDGLEFVATAGKVSDGLNDCAGWQEDFNAFDTAPVHSGYCYRPVSLPTNLRLRVSAYLGKRISELQGWFDGRIAEPNIDFGVATAGTVTVEGAPIPVNYARTSIIPKGDPLYDVSPEVEAMQGASGTGGIYTPMDGISSFVHFASKIPLAAAARNTVWRVSSWNQAGSLGKCQSAPGVKGIVLTNATTYASAPPSLDPQSGSLNFQVASTHLNPDNSLSQGDYTLFLQDGLAKCIWGETVNGSATVSVVDEDGKSDPATTSMSVSNGWVIFHAAGFHYSAPTIQVKLTPAITYSVKTVTCVKTAKGKVTTKVIKLGQKCPAGFTKKA